MLTDAMLEFCRASYKPGDTECEKVLGSARSGSCCLIDKPPRYGAPDCSKMDASPLQCSKTNNSCLWDVKTPRCCQLAKAVDKTVVCKTVDLCTQQSVGTKAYCQTQASLLARAKSMCLEKKQTLDVSTLNWDSAACRVGTFGVLNFECCSAPAAAKPCTTDSSCGAGMVCVNKFCEQGRIACGSQQDCPYHSPYCVAGFCSKTTTTKCRPFSGIGCKTSAQWLTFAKQQCTLQKLVFSSMQPDSPCPKGYDGLPRFASARWTCCPTTSTGTTAPG